MPTTSGFVQRATLLSGPTLCAWIGPSPTSTEVFVVQIRSSDSEASVRTKRGIIDVVSEAYFAGREIDVTHGSDSATITAAGTRTCSVAATPVVLDAIEATQAIQDLAHSIPLLAGKRTVVRVYLSNHSSSSLTVQGELAVRRSSGGSPTIVPSENAVTLDPAHAGDLTVKRDDASRSLNFVLPPSQTAEGALQVRLAEVTNSSGGAVVPVGCERRLTLWFHASPPLRVRVLGIRYTMGTPPISHAPSPLDFALLVSWLRRAYPTGNPVASTATVDSTTAPTFGCGQVNAQLAAIRALDMSSGGDDRTHYFGLVADSGFWMRGCSAGIPGSPDPSVVASGPTGPATWGWDFDGSYGDWYGGHELGHTFGRLHPGFCGESQNDLANYPFEGGQLANGAGSFAGFDVGDPANGLPMVALPGTEWHDVMTYCDKQWLGPYTYLGIRQRLVAEDAAASGASSPGPGPGSPGGGRLDRRFVSGRPPGARGLRPGGEVAGPVLVSVVCTVNLTRRDGRVQFVNPLERGSMRGVVEVGEVALRVRGGDNELLNEYTVEARLNSELLPSDDRVGIVDAAILVDPGGRAIELVIGEETVDSFAIGGPEPRMGAVQLADAERGRFTVGIETAPPEVDQTASAQRFSVQVSQDGGQSWETVAVGLPEPSFELDRRHYRKGARLIVRVIGTNGLARSVVSSEELEI